MIYDIERGVGGCVFLFNGHPGSDQFARCKSSFWTVPFGQKKSEVVSFTSVVTWFVIGNAESLVVAEKAWFSLKA